MRCPNGWKWKFTVKAKYINSGSNIGSDKNGKEHVGEPVTGLEMIGNTNKTGTKVTFKPDAKVFHGNIDLNYDTLAERLQEIAFLNSGLKVTLKDKRTGKQDDVSI